MHEARQADPAVHEFQEAVDHLLRGEDPGNIAAYIESVIQRYAEQGAPVDARAAALADQAISEMGGGLLGQVLETAIRGVRKEAAATVGPTNIGAAIEGPLQAAHRGATWTSVYDEPEAIRVLTEAGFVPVARVPFNPDNVSEEMRPALEALGNPDAVMLSFGANAAPERVFDDWDNAVDYTRALARPADPRKGLARPDFSILEVADKEKESKKLLADIRQAEKLLESVDPDITALEADEIRDTEGWIARMAAAVMDESGEVSVETLTPSWVKRRGLDVEYEPRTGTAGELTVQMPKARSQYLPRLIETAANKASKQLDTDFVRDKAGIRTWTMTERVAKHAGRSQRQEMYRRQSAVSREIATIIKIKEGSDEDVAMFWYAQLPAAYRNADGLRLIQREQANELRKLESGETRKALLAEQTAWRIAMKELNASPDSTKGAVMKIQDELNRIERELDDLPLRKEDVAKSLEQLQRVIKKEPASSQKVLDALRVLETDRRRYLVEGGRLKEGRAEAREGLVARWLGLEPDGTEIYMGHRLPRSDRGVPMQTPRGGGGPVSSPQGMSENKLVIAKMGRLRQSTRVAAEDWQQAAVFDEALVARNDLAKLPGVNFTGRWLKDHTLINAKGEVVPAYWRSEEFSQFAETGEDIEETRQLARDIVDGFFADNRDSAEAMVQRLKEEALEEGREFSYDGLKLVPNRLVERYYSQYKGAGKAGKFIGYDAAVDLAAFSIITFRIGFIPKNVVQNLIMVLPHQGAFILPNAVKAVQAMADSELRHLLRGEIGRTGSTIVGEEASRLPVGRFMRWTGDKASLVADEPARISAWMHEAAAAGIISRTSPFLTPKDRANIIEAFKNKKHRPRLNDVRTRSVDGMGDFGRLTPEQGRWARRLLIIPGWLMAGTRYPIHFSLTHPVRSALIAYILMGEPGAPDELRYNEPITHYFEGRRWLRGIETPWGRVRTTSLNPVSLPWEMMFALGGTIQGKKNPFDIDTPVLFDYANPLLATLIAFLDGQESAVDAIKRLGPNVGFIEAMISPEAHKSYPEDVTRWGRIQREFGVIPIDITDEASGGKRRRRSTSGSKPPGLGGRGGSKPPGFGGSGGSKPPGF